MDPESQDSSNSCILFRILNDAPRVSDWETIEKWQIVGTTMKASSNRIRSLDKELDVLVNAKAIVLESREHLHAEITRKEAERIKLELTLFRAIAFKKMKKIQLLQQVGRKLMLQLEEQKAKIEIVRKDIADDRRRVEEVKVTVHSLGTQLAEKDKSNDVLKMHVLTLGSKLGKKELELTRELQEKKVLIATVDSLGTQLAEKDKANDVLKMRLLTLDSEMKRKLEEEVRIMDLTRKKDQAERDALTLRQQRKDYEEDFNPSLHWKRKAPTEANRVEESEMSDTDSENSSIVRTESGYVYQCR